MADSDTGLGDILMLIHAPPPLLAGPPLNLQRILKINRNRKMKIKKKRKGNREGTS